MAVVLKGHKPGETVRLFTCKTFALRLKDYARMEAEAAAMTVHEPQTRYEREPEPDES